jgi:hypothetical protein
MTMHRIIRAARGGLAIVLAMACHPALAASGNTTSVTGTASAVVTQPITLKAVSSLQFGTIAQPVSGGTLVLSPQSTITTTGDVGASRSIAQSTTPAAATFSVTGLSGALFSVSGSSSVTISNGTKTMTVSGFTINGSFSGGQIGVNGSATFNIGATLTIAPAQAIGTYTGLFPITVTYY